MKKFYVFCLFVVTNFAAFSQLSGTFTIDVNGSGTTNYTSFTAAVTALSANGVNGPVIFNVAAGTYSEQLTVPAITGTSSTNTITFQANPSNTAPAEITYSPTGTTDNWTIHFNQTNNIIVKGLKITSGGTTYGRLITYTGSSDLKILDNTLVGAASGQSTSSDLAAFYYNSTSAYPTGTWVIKGNDITDVSYGFYIYGNSSNNLDTLRIEDNTLATWYYGMYSYYHKNPKILNNTFNKLGGSTNIYGYNYLYYPSGNAEFKGNTINGYRYGCYMYASAGSQTWDVQDNTLNEVGYYGFYISNSSAGRAEKVTLKNNSISMNLVSTFAYGLYLGYVDGAQGRSEVSNNLINIDMPSTSTVYTFYAYALDSVDVVFNTFAVQSSNGATGGSTYGIYGGSTGSNYGTKFRNNIFANAVGGPAANFLATGVSSGMYSNMNYNLYYGTTSTPVTWGATGCASLSALQTASSQEANGQWGDPAFSSASDAHVEGLLADGTATPIAGITLDIDGDTRNSTTPDIGADEFTPPACAKPSGVNFTSLLPYSASFTWAGNAGGYELEWGPTGYVQGTGTTASSSTASATITVSPATTYDVYIRSNCVAAGNGYSAWYGPVSFTTPCIVQSLPVTENFNNWTPACWDLSGGTAAWQHYTTGGVTLARAYYWGNNDKSFIMESPLINLNVDGQIKFDWSHWGQYITSYPYDSLSVRVRSASSTTWDNLLTLKGSTFAMADGSSTAPAATLTSEVVYIPTSYTGDTVVVQFYAWSDYGPDLFIDNIEIEEAGCPLPIITQVSSTSTSSTFSWYSSNGNTPLGSKLIWGPVGFYSGTGTITGNVINNASSPYTVTGLSSSSIYDLYIVDSCGPNSLSNLVGPLTFTSTCELNGTYTIDNSMVTGNGNYNNFNDAIIALVNCGVGGPVTFNVKQGTYTEQVTIPAVTGASATNKITFQADPTNTSAATVTYSPTGTTDNWTVRLNGCNDVTIKGLTITTGGTTYGRLVDHTGNVTNISLLDNTFNGVAGTSTSSYFAGIYYTSPSEAKGVWHVEGNTMNNISYGVYVYGSSYTTSMDSIFIENNVINTSYYGLYPRYAKYQKVHGNTVNALGTYAYNYLYYPLYGVDAQNNTMNCGTGYGFYIYTSAPTGYSPYLIVENNNINAGTYGIYASCAGTSTYSPWSAASIKKNNIVLSGTTNYGIYLAYANFPSSAPGVIENNMIASNGTGTIYGYYPYHVANAVFQHNSINVSAGSLTAGRAVYLNATTSTSYFTAGGNVLKNNIIVNAGGGYALEASSTAAAGTYFTSDYNNYYASSTTPFGTGSSTLSAWQTASSQDVNSVWGDPLFVSNSDLHVYGTITIDAGTPLGVTTDIDGDPRSQLTPDIGADEIPCLGGSIIPYFEDFNDEIPCNWSTSGFGTQWAQVDNYGGNQIDSTGFLFIDDDVVGSTAPPTISSISSPYFEASTYNSLTLEFDSYWRQYANSQIGRIEVYDGQTWVEIGALTSTAGSWSSPLHYSFDLSAYLNDSLSVRFTYDDTYGSGPSSWGYYWAIDNFQLEGNATGCPINVAPIVSTVEICGPDTVQLNASAINTQNEVIWLNASSQVVGAGNTYDLGYVTQDTGHSVALFAFEDNSPRVEFGPSITGLGGFGNFSNGTWFTANSAISLDSITVRANGNVNFKVNVYSSNGGNASQGNIGNLLQSSDVINVGSGDSKVPVDLLLTPGNYFLNFSFLPGTTGALYRTITGANYPYSTSFMSIDSVQYPSGVRAYYAFDWVVRKGCVGPSEQALVDYHDLPTPIITSSTNSTNLSTNVELTASGPDNYQYLWDDLTNTAIRNVYPSQTTSYWVIATDSNGCQASDTIVVNTVDITFQVDLSTQPVNTSKGVHLAGNFNGWQPDSTAMTDANGDGIYTVTVGLVAGDSTIQYKFINGDSWSDPHDQVSGFCSVNATGDRLYAVPFTNDTISPVHLSSCTIDQPVDVLVDVQPTVCYSDTVILDAGTSVWNVVWNTGDTSQTLAVTQPGTYWFSANYWAGNPGITVFDTTVVNHFAMPDTSVTASGSLDFCLGSSVTLSAASGQSYMWNTGDTTQSITATQAGSYYAVVTTSNGCSDTTATYTTSLYADPDLTVTASGSLDFCLGSSVTLSAASGQSYMWNTGDTTQSITATQAGSYYAVVTTSNGCSDTTATYTTSLYADPDLTVTASGSLDFCQGSSVTLSAASGQSYMWNTGDTTQSITATQAGSYYAVVTTSNGCSDTTATYTTSLYADPDTTVTASQTIFCASESATISAAGGYDYLWNTGDTTQSITVNTAGGYYVTLTSSDGCSATSDTTMITVVPDIVLPQITSNGLGWVITGSTTGFSVTVDTNYTYQWGIQGGSIQFGQGTDSIAVLWGIPDSNVAVWVVISNGVCSDSVGISINISGIGTDEGALQNVRLFPNPNDGYFTIEVGEAFVGASYEIVDGMGRPIERGEIQSQTQAFDLADKPKGVYRIVLQNGSLFKTLIVTLQ